MSYQPPQPPATIVRTFEFGNGLQLHRLVESVRFNCVLCRQDKTAMRIATRGSDWTQTICGACLYSMVKGKWKQEAKRKAGSSAKPAIAKEQSGQLTRQPPGIDDLLKFFRDAGVDAQLGPTGRLWIDGYQVAPLNQLPSSDTSEWINIVNEIALKYARYRFIRAVEQNARFGPGIDVSLLPDGKGAAVMRGDVNLAVIHPAHASIPHRPSVYANFLNAGPHWQQVIEDVHKAKANPARSKQRQQEAKVAKPTVTAAKVARRPANAWRRIDQLPGNLPSRLINACLEASRRIRLERHLAYEGPVVLECDLGELMLLPITGTGRLLLVPFRLSMEAKTVQGELILGDRDPLPIRIDNGVAKKDAITAWTCALLGFADATCIEFDPAEPTARRRPKGPRRHSRSLPPRHRPPTQTLPRRQRWPSYLEPVGQWTRYGGSLVAAHRRRLADGKTASDEARDRARQVGIILRPHETWVKAHARGLPSGVEMRFLWNAPTGLALFGAVHRGPSSPATN